MTDQFQKFLNKPMHRKEFLRYSGILLFTLIGGFSILDNFSKSELFKKYPHQTKGYGSSSYGGVEKNS